MDWSPWNLAFNAERSSEKDDDLMISMNWVGLAHCALPTFAFINLLYILIIRNCINKQSNIITNLFCVVLIGQLFICFGYQVGYLYYNLVSIEFVIFAVLICQNIGFCTLSFGAAMISLVYYYIIKHNYLKICRLFFGNQRWHLIFCYLLYAAIWVTLVCYHWIFVRILFMIFIPGCLILHLIFYCKLGGYCLCKCNNSSGVNPRQNLNEKPTQSGFVVPASADETNSYYKIGLFGSSLFVISFGVSPIFGVVFGAIPNVILAILVGISYCAIHVGFNYIASLDISKNMHEKAMSQQFQQLQLNNNQHVKPTSMSTTPVHHEVTTDVDTAIIKSAWESKFNGDMNEENKHKDNQDDKYHDNKNDECNLGGNAVTLETVLVDKMTDDITSSAKNVAVIDKPVHDREVVRWDLLVFYYLFGVALTSASFGLSYDFKYNKYVLFCAYIHFCGEMTIASYFLYKPTIAKLLSIIVHVLMLPQAFILLPIMTLAQISKVFSFVFLFSDCYGMLASMVVTLNPYAPACLQRVAFGVGFHFVGVTMSLCHLPMKMYYNTELPQTGYVWLLIGLALPLQIWFSMDFLQSKHNNICAKNIKYGSNNHEKVHKYGPAFGSLILAMICSIISITRTTESQDDLFAYPPTSYVIAALGFPLSCVVLMTMGYIWTRGRAMIIQKDGKNATEDGKWE